MSVPRSSHRGARRRLATFAIVIAAGGSATFASDPGAFAASGTTSASILGGSLSVGTVGTMSPLAPTLGGPAATGTLPSAVWQDSTGSGSGWAGTIAVSPLSYTGTWVAGTGAPALSSTAAGSYTDTVDGVSYTVKVTSAVVGASVNFSYTSTDSNDASGTGSALASTPVAVGTKGITITFNLASTYAAGNTYTVLAGTQSASALTLYNTSGTITANGTTSPLPVFVNSGTSLPAGATVGSVNSAGAVKFLSAALGQGAGSYTAAPGVQMLADTNSWAKTYTGSLVYSITSGP